MRDAQRKGWKQHSRRCLPLVGVASKDVARKSELEFTAWARRWMALAAYTGRRLPDEAGRISAVVALWQEPIPGGWKRGPDRRLLDPQQRYCRGNNRPEDLRRGEHAIEYDVLAP